MGGLTLSQTARFEDFVVPQLAAIERTGRPEEDKLVMIGRVVEAALRDLLPAYGSTPADTRIGPAVTTPHNDGSIDRLAQYQCALRHSDLPKPLQAQILGNMELQVLDELASSNRKRAIGRASGLLEENS